MKTKALATIVLAIVAASCSDATPQIIEVNEQDIEVCCDPEQGPPGKVGEFDIFINEETLAFLDPASLEAQITYTNVDGTPVEGPVRLSIPSGASLPLGTTTVEVFVEDCDFTEEEIQYDIRVRGVRNDSRESFFAGASGTFTVTNDCLDMMPPGTGGVSGMGGTGGTGATGGSPGDCDVPDVQGEAQMTQSPTGGTEGSPGQEVQFLVSVDDDAVRIDLTLLADDLAGPPAGQGFAQHDGSGQVMVPVTLAGNAAPGTYFVDVELNTTDDMNNRQNLTFYTQTQLGPPGDDYVKVVVSGGQFGDEQQTDCPIFRFDVIGD